MQARKKKEGVELFISNKVEFMIKSIKQDKEKQYNAKRPNL